MSAPIRIGGREIDATTILAVLLMVTLVAALITPQNSDDGDTSSYSASLTGSRMAYDLAQRMGWRTTRRTTTLDSVPSRAVQVVVGPRTALGATEVHRLLENVRSGGGLIFDAVSAEEIADSVGILVRRSRVFLVGGEEPGCKRAGTTFAQGMQMVGAPSVSQLAWKRPPPGKMRKISIPGGSNVPLDVGIAFSLGAGRVAALGSPAFIQNYALRTCAWRIDVGYVRALESVWPANTDHPHLEFDDFHHGRGAHGGSIEAAWRYLAHTSSGRFLAQVVLAALALLLASAPRPIVPHDAERVPRRSPLEHADALAHAYSDVRATRTAASRLVSGLRRRAGRTVQTARSADDDAFLAAVALRSPSTADSVAIVRRALAEPMPNREFTAVAAAVLEIERQLTLPSPSRT